MEKRVGGPFPLKLKDVPEMDEIDDIRLEDLETPVLELQRRSRAL